MAASNKEASDVELTPAHRNSANRFLKRIIHRPVSHWGVNAGAWAPVNQPARNRLKINAVGAMRRTSQSETIGNLKDFLTKAVDR